MIDFTDINSQAGFNQTAGMFNFSFAPGVSLEQMTNFKAAGLAWSAYLDDDITINIHVETTDYLAEDVIGAALPRIESGVNYDKVIKALGNEISSEEDSLAFNHLPGTYEWEKGDEKEGRRGRSGIKRGSNKFDVLVEGGLVKDAKKLNLTSANAKALGLSKLKEDDLDGYILMSNLNKLENINWDYNFLDDQTTGVDFYSVAIHEIGHVMGFVSGVDDNEWLTQVGNFEGVDYSNITYEKFEEEGSFIQTKEIKSPEMATPLDLFRFTELSASQQVIDLSVSDEAYFSIDGGDNKIANFSSGEDYQASHWSLNSNTGIMDPTIQLNERRYITTTDLVTMDVIGYDRKTTADDNSTNAIGTQLAQQLGISFDQLDQILGNDQVDAALPQNIEGYRVEDILTMIEKSKVYEWGFGGGSGYHWGFGGGSGYHWGFGGGSGYHWGFGGGSGYHSQMAPYFPMLSQYFSTLDSSIIDAARNNNQDSPGNSSELDLGDIIDWNDAPSQDNSSNPSDQSINWSDLEVNTDSGLDTQIIFTDEIEVNGQPGQNNNLVQELIQAL